MIEEGFSEKQMIDAILGDSKIIESYDADKRCLIIKYFLWRNKKGRQALIKCLCWPSLLNIFRRVRPLIYVIVLA